MVAVVDKKLAALVLEDAVKRAKTDEVLSVEWASYARTIFAFESKTYTPALATLLLAKTVNPSVDVMAIKATGVNAYSMRGICHSVVVPAATKYGFSIRNTGREPINNQPFFRYDRIDQIERVRSQADFDHFLAVVERAALLSKTGAAQALAAFIRVALEEAGRHRSLRVTPVGLTPGGVIIASEDFLRYDAPDRPRRLQAFAAACLDLTHTDVRSRRINDPSRDLPGDVQAYSDSEPVLSIEVRGKEVSPADAASFIEACDSVGLGRMAIFVDAVGQPVFEIVEVESTALRSGRVQFDMYFGAAELIEASLFWSQKSVALAVSGLAQRIMDRLKQIEVADATLNEWNRAVAVAQMGASR